MKVKNFISSQSAGIYSLIVAAALYFIYSLGFMTNFYILFYDGDSAMFEVFSELQLMNKFIFEAALITLLMAIFTVITGFHKKDSGLFHMIYILAFLGYEINNLSIILRAIPYYQNKYLSIDYSVLENYKVSTLVFTLSYVFGIGILLILLLNEIIFFICRFKRTKKEKEPGL